MHTVAPAPRRTEPTARPVTSATARRPSSTAARAAARVARALPLRAVRVAPAGPRTKSFAPSSRSKSLDGCRQRGLRHCPWRAAAVKVPCCTTSVNSGGNRTSRPITIIDGGHHSNRLNDVRRSPTSRHDAFVARLGARGDGHLGRRVDHAHGAGRRCPAPAPLLDVDGAARSARRDRACAPARQRASRLSLPFGVRPPAGRDAS